MKSKKLKYNNGQALLRQGSEGQAMITAVVFFMFLSLSIMLGLALPATRDFRSASDLMRSKQSFFLSESGLEDVTYRLKKNKQVDVSETLVLAGGSAVTTITDITSNKKEITALGDIINLNRKNKTILSVGEGASFNYGIQAGTGGFSMQNNSGIYGNVYANGSITGSTINSFVTGSAYAANSSELTANQLNDVPASPPNSIIFGNANATQDVAQSFQISSSDPLNKVALFIKKTGSPGNITVRIVNDSADAPGSTTYSSGNLSSSLVTNSFGWVEVALSPNYLITPGVSFWLVLNAPSGGSATKNFTWAANSAYVSGQAKIGRLGVSWSNTVPAGLDGYFKIYLGGTNSSISSVVVGQNGIGNAAAHTVTDSSVAGNLYCQTGSGNNKNCDTSQSDPAPQNFPISQAVIDGWKIDATTGGTINGNYNITQDTSLGPKKINGNLSMTSPNKTLTVTGTIYVTGNIDISANGSSIKCALSFGENSCVIVADGWIHIDNNGNFSGSGTAGSFLFLISDSSCDGSNSNPPCDTADHYAAIDLHNNGQGAVYYATKGLLNLHNNVNITAAAAYKIDLSQGAAVTYDQGLINQNFVSGPSAGWDIEGWREVE